MRKWFVSIIVALVSAVSTAPLALAASTGAGQGLEISPPVVELNANPGQNVTTTIRIRNITNGTLIVKSEVDDFGAGDKEDGNPHILLNETGATRFSLKYWVQPLADMTLAPQELKVLSVSINVPKNAEPGGHYGVVRFTGVPANLQSTGVSLSASIGTLMLMRVNGQVTDDLSIASFNSGTLNKNGDFTNKNFFEYGPVSFNVRIKNDGSVHEKPQGSIVVKNLFGGGSQTVPVNASGGNVLPGSVRKFTETLAKKDLFGYYTATLNLTYLNGTKKLSSVVHFWVIPWKMILLVLVLIVVLFFVLRLALRKYNERIIAQARKR